MSSGAVGEPCLSSHVQEPVYVHGGHAVDVYGLGLLLFRDQVVHHPPVGQTLRETMLNMVNRERNGERSER